MALFIITDLLDVLWRSDYLGLFAFLAEPNLASFYRPLLARVCLFLKIFADLLMELLSHQYYVFYTNYQ